MRRLEEGVRQDPHPHPLPSTGEGTGGEGTGAIVESIEARILLAGFTGTYFNNADLTNPAYMRSDAQINFDWQSAAPAAGIAPMTYSARWTGKIKPAYSQTYTFTLTADDGVRLYVGGQLLIDRWADRSALAGDADRDGVVSFNDYQLLERQLGTSGPESDYNGDGTVSNADFKLLYNNMYKTLAQTAPVNTATMALTAGQSYDLVLEYYQDENAGSAKLEWQSASQAKQLVPASNATTLGNGLLATYYNETTLAGTDITRVDPTVNFDWGTAAPDARIEASTFTARWQGLFQAPSAGSYTLYFKADEGARVWVDDGLKIDHWTSTALTEWNTGALTLAAGLHKIKIEYLDTSASASAQLSWTGPSIAKQVIPTDFLFVGDPATTTAIADPTPMSIAQLPGALRVSTNKRFIERSDGNPFFWMADTAWRFFFRTQATEADQYLTDRAAREFSVIYAAAYNSDISTSDIKGNSVFVNGDVTQPNEQYFKYIDYILNKANELGLYVAMLPTWGDSVSATTNREFNATTGYAYTNWLAKRYKNQPNLIWVLGGDAPGEDSTGQAAAIWRSMAAGLIAGDGGSHLITYHPNGSPPSSSTWFQNDSWLSFNSYESGHTRDSSLAYTLASADYARTSPYIRPVLDFEPNYENIPNGLNPALPPLTDYDVRKKLYWATFAGTFGATYGNWEIYEFNTKLSAQFPYKKTWQTALSYPGAVEMKFLRRLIQSRPYLMRVPDQSILTTSALTGGNYIGATRASDGAYAMVYSASGQTFTVNMTKVGGPNVDSWWYNPRDGSSTYIGRVGNPGTRQFIPPSTGTDWILVMDNVAKGYGAPGVGIAPAAGAAVPAAAPGAMAVIDTTTTSSPSASSSSTSTSLSGTPSSAATIPSPPVVIAPPRPLARPPARVNSSIFNLVVGIAKIKARSVGWHG